MAGRFSTPNEQFLDENGDPLAGGKLAFFVSGTSTPQDTFSDDALTVANTNPVILNSAGRAGDIFLSNADYKVTLSKADDTVVWTADPVRSTTQKSSEVRNVTTTTQLDSSDDGKWIAADATAGGFVITLPAVADVGNGFEITIQKVDDSANTVTVDGSGSETINGLSDVTLDKQYEAITLRGNGTRWLSPLEEGRGLPPNHIDGLRITNGSTPATDIDVSAGSCRADDDSANIVMENAITKKLNAAFAEGNNQGCLDTGTVAADTVYDIYEIGKSDGTADVLATTKGSSPALPSGFTTKKFIGRLPTDGSSNIVSEQITQQEVDGQYYEARVDVSSGNSATIDAMMDTPDRVDLSLSEISFTGTASLRMRLGGDSGIDATNYNSLNNNLSGSPTSTTEFLLTNQSGGNFQKGTATILREGTRQTTGDEIYTYSSLGTGGSSGGTNLGAGRKVMNSQAFSKAEFTPSSGDFDGADGSITVRAYKQGAYAP